MHSNHDKKLMKASKKSSRTNKRKVSGSGKEVDNKSEVESNWKNKFKQVIKMTNGIKTIMSV